MENEKKAVIVPDELTVVMKTDNEGATRFKSDTKLFKIFYYFLPLVTHNEPPPGIVILGITKARDCRHGPRTQTYKCFCITPLHILVYPT